MINRIREFLELPGIAEQGQAEEVTPGRGRDREPSPRNKDIYHGVRTQGFTQEEIALRYGISQTRVSQIIRQGDRWFAAKKAATKVVASPADRRRLASYLDLARLETIYTLAMRDHQRCERRQCTSKSGSQGSQIWSETTHRERAVNSQPLRVALRALELMWELDERNAEAEGGVNSVSNSPSQAAGEESLPPAPADATPEAESGSADGSGCTCAETSPLKGCANPGLVIEGGGE